MKLSTPSAFIYLIIALFVLSSCFTLERRQLEPTRDREKQADQEKTAEQGSEESAAESSVPAPPVILLPERVTGDAAEDGEELVTQPQINRYQRISPLPLVLPADSDEQLQYRLYGDYTSGHILRVRLFEQNKPSSYTIAPGAGSLELTDGAGFSIRLHDEAGEAAIHVRPGSQEIEIRHNNLRYTSASWTIDSEPNGMMRIRHPDLGWRFYRGSAEVSVHSGRIRTINHVDLEDYVASVVGGEMNFNNMEALKVQSVISRTYALWNSTISASSGRGYDLSDYVMSQVYPGELIHSPQYRAAALATSGEVLAWSGRIILAVYHSTCGGRTSANEEVWSGNALPYLRGRNDNGSCSASPHYTWNFEISKREFYRMFGVSKISGINTDNSGRVTSFNFIENGRETTRTANDIRLRLNRTHGALALRSTFFGLDEDEDYYIFNGRGLGHGLGLCQWGALGLAETGWSYQDILRFYYNGAEIVDVESLGDAPFRLARF